MQQTVQGDLRIYADWADGLGAGGGLPVGDERWQYPPGAAVAIILPEIAHSLLVAPYRVAFVAMVVCVDAVVTAALARRDRGAALYWVAGIAALGPVALARFDLLPAAAALGAVLAAARARPARVGWYIGVGTLLKVWPGLLLVALPRPTRRAPARGGAWWSWAAVGRVVGGLVAAAVAFAVVALLTGWWRDVFGFVGAQQARGLQVEAVAATPFVLAQMAGGPAPTYSYGSLQFDGPLARAVATACSATEALVIVLAVVWWWARARSDAAAERSDVVAATLARRCLALVTVVVVTARVLSPQYLVWLLALTASVLAVGPRPGSPPVPSSAAGPDTVQAAPAHKPAPGPALEPAPVAWRRVRRGVARFGRLPVALLVMALLSQVIYPWRYNDVLEGRIVLGLLLVGRNVLLLIACWWAVQAVAARRGPGSPRSPAPRPERR